MTPSSSPSPFPSPAASGSGTSLIHNAREVRDHITTLADQIAESCLPDNPIHLVGIHSGGAVLAQRLAPLLTQRGVQLLPPGSVDIALYRDDLADIALPQLRGTELNFPIEGARIVLIDDILFTGRTIRSALQALTDHGRPAWVRLAVYADRGHRELPIQPDFVALRVETQHHQRLTLRLNENSGDDALELR